MTTNEPDFARMAKLQEIPPAEIPAVVRALAAGSAIEPVYRNELGGMTFRVGARFVKWNPRSTNIDLARERMRLDWLAGRHPAPRVVAYDEDADAQWLVTIALSGNPVGGYPPQTKPSDAIAAMVAGLHAIHAVAIDDAPAWLHDSWVTRQPPSLGPRPRIEDPVLVHGDPCPPNTLVDERGTWVGNVDFGDLAVGDRWADLAVASMSLDWNFGEGHQHAFFDAYGIERDEERIRYYRELWHLES